MNNKPRKPRLTAKVVKSLSMASGYVAADAQGMEGDELKTHAELRRAVKYIDQLAYWYHSRRSEKIK